MTTDIDFSELTTELEKIVPFSKIEIFDRGVDDCFELRIDFFLRGEICCYTHVICANMYWRDEWYRKEVIWSSCMDVQEFITKKRLGIGT